MGDWVSMLVLYEVDDVEGMVRLVGVEGRGSMYLLLTKYYFVKEEW